MNSEFDNYTLKEFVASDAMKNRIASNTDYYKSKWSKLIEAYGDIKLSDPTLEKKLMSLRSWNWISFVFGCYWGIWRRVRYSWLALSIVSLLSLMEIFFPEIGQALIWGGIGIAITFGMYGNNFYLISLVKSRNDLDSTATPSLIHLFLGIGVTVGVSIVTADIF
jgi:hypothetical protein